MRIAASGTRWVETAPDLGVVSLAVVAEHRDRRSAFDGASTAAASVVAAVEREIQGAAEGAVTRLTVSPISLHSWRPHSETGELLPEVHNASAQISAAFRDVDQLSRFAAEAGRMPHVQLTGIAWELTEETRREVEDHLTGAAVVEALRKAQVVADAAGAGPVTVLEISEPGLMAQASMEFAAKAMRFDAAGGQEGIDPEFLQIVPAPVRTEVTIQVRCEA